MTGERQMLHSSLELVDLRNRNLVSHNLVPGKTTEYVLLEAISGHKKANKNSQHGYTKSIR